MSYTRSYSASLTVSGSETVYVPASEYGRNITVNYTRTVPVNFDVTVETTEFDSSVHRAGTTVDGLTASVAAMNAANCAVIAKNADDISNSLIDGFYSLIQSDITTKKAESHSQLQAKTALLMELANDVKDKHERMSSDLDRLRAHYGAIFRDLDSELAKRIRDIDRPAFGISEKARNRVITEPALEQGAETADMTANEGVRSSAISVARIRSKVSQVLSTMADSIRNNKKYRKEMHNTLWNEKADRETELFVPTAYFVSDTIGANQLNIACYAPETAHGELLRTQVGNYVASVVNSQGRTIPEDEMKYIDQAFSSMVESLFIGQSGENGETSEHDKRVYAEILRLWQTNKVYLQQI